MSFVFYFAAQRLKEHIASHDELTLACPECAWMFENQANLTMHRHRKHGKSMTGSPGQQQSSPVVEAGSSQQQGPVLPTSETFSPDNTTSQGPTQAPSEEG